MAGPTQAVLSGSTARVDPFAFLLAAFVVVVVLTGMFAAMAWTVLRLRYQRRLEEETAAALGRAVRRILHQIKNPIASLSLYVNLLRDPALAPPLPEAARVLRQELDRLQGLLRELQDYAAGVHRPITWATIELRPLLERLVEGRREAARLHGVELELQCEPDVRVRGDASLLEQAIENLVTNALDAVDGKADGRVWVRARGDEATVRVEVIDNGPGIPRGERARIFQPFVSTKRRAAGASGGMGLGLPIAREIARQHGGTLEVMSRPGWTVFKLVLPRARG